MAVLAASMDTSAGVPYSNICRKLYGAKGREQTLWSSVRKCITRGCRRPMCAFSVFLSQSPFCSFEPSKSHINVLLGRHRRSDPAALPMRVATYELACVVITSLLLFADCAFVIRMQKHSSNCI